MKKVFMAALVLGAVSMTSCKKEVTCVCSVLLSSETTERTVKAKDGEEVAECLKEAKTLSGEVCVPK
ncbi:MAG: hypothetical protein AB8B74_11520 [Crocinitomicaceae bacterium]